MQQQLTNDKPKPKYKKGDLIILNSGRRGHIIDKPKWNDWCNEIEPQWIYEYDYNLGCSEGFVIESNIKQTIK